MHNESKKVHPTLQVLAAFIALVLILSILSAVIMPQKAFADTGEARTLIVTVVEEIPVDEIDDDDVPLASFGDAEKRISESTRHVLLMSALLLFVTVYVFYFSTYEKRLGSLRYKAAEAESRWHAERKAKWGECP